MGTTIKEIAKKADVSIASVSHVLNQTRYVSPKLSQKILAATNELGYEVKKEKKNHPYKKGKLSEIALVIPGVLSGFYSRIIMVLSSYAAKEGYLLSVHLSGDDSEREWHLLREIMVNRRVAGIILSGVSEDKSRYKKLQESNIPLLFLERGIMTEKVKSIISDNMQGVYCGTEHMIKCGHKKIALLLEKSESSAVEERKAGFCKALLSYDIPYQEEAIVYIDLNNLEEGRKMIQKQLQLKEYTAIFAGGNILTLQLLKVMSLLGLDCPEDVSIVGFGDDQWCELVNLPLTILKQNVSEMGFRAMDYMIKRISDIQAGKAWTLCGLERIAMELQVRNSVLSIASGPFGEKMVYPEEEVLSEEEAELLQHEDYKIAISFHYSGDMWTRIHEQAIIETLGACGIRILSVADAHFDPNLQKKQLEAIMMQNPDAVIAVPTDEEKTSEMFKEIAGKTKLILINSMPKSFAPEDYSCWISVNERENGQNAARILGDYFQGQMDVKVGILSHGVEYFATKQRDFFAEQVLVDQYPNIQVVEKRNFCTIENAYDTCKEMVLKNPEIQGLYITWERPALGAIQALKEIGRTDIVISTTDLDYEIADYMARNEMVIGLSSQRPYDQGVAVAIATAKSLLGTCSHKCIGVPACRVEASNLEKAWKNLFKTEVPNLVKKSN
ncbi:LacI family DNA-binding transcriptional regulator [Lachnospiraceae bacterium ZAX-1]